MAKAALKTKATQYDESSIVALEGLEGVREKCAFYLGSPPDDRGIFQVAKEALDNGADEMMVLPVTKDSQVGFAIDADGWFYVWDTGRGIPVGVHEKFKKQKLSTLTVVMTKLHAGGKINKQQTGYKKSRGTHGVGISVTNALASDFRVDTCRDGQWYTQSFKQGKPHTKVTEIKSNKRIQIPRLQNQPKHGTVIRWMPDKDIFKKAKLDQEHMAEWMTTQSFLQAGVAFWFISPTMKECNRQKEGLRSFIKECLEETKSEQVTKMFSMQNDDVDVAITWSTHPEAYVYSYVNGSNTEDGGTHLNGLYKAITKALDDHANRNHEYNAKALQFGLIGALNISLKSPEFDNQLKDQLVTKDATDVVFDNVYPLLKEHFAKHKKDAKFILQRATEYFEANEEMKLSSKALAQLKPKKGRPALPPPNKFSASRTKNPALRELAIVEGDSAGGETDKARNPMFHEVLKLRGKILNVYKAAKQSKIFESEEILYIMQSIGYNPKFKKREDAIKNLRVGKVIIFTDPDPDGKHISILLLAFFQKFLPEMFERGMIYVVDAPLYHCQIGAKPYYGKSYNHLASLVPGKKLPRVVTRIKGWGEVKANVIKPVVWEKGSRRLTRVTPIAAKQIRDYVAIMGDNPEARKKLLGV